MPHFLSRLLGRAGRARLAAPPPPERKASRAGPLIALHGVGRPLWTPRDYGAFAREGYQKNAIAHRSIRLIAEAAASVPWLLREGRRDIDAHPLLTLIARPNPRESGPALIEALYGHLLVAYTRHGARRRAGRRSRRPDGRLYRRPARHDGARLYVSLLPGQNQSQVAGPISRPNHRRCHGCQENGRPGGGHLPQAARPR